MYLLIWGWSAADLQGFVIQLWYYHNYSYTGLPISTLLYIVKYISVFYTITTIPWMLFIVINLEWLAWSTQGFSGYRSMFIWQILASIDKKYPISNSLVSVLDGQSMELMWHPLLSIQDTTETNSRGAPSEDSTVCIGS